jgi:hypothetical protein
MTQQSSLTPAEAFSLARRAVGRRDEAAAYNNTCPVCDGFGSVPGDQLNVPYDCPPEYDELACLACNGSGELTEPADEPVVLPDADDWLMSYASRDYLPTAED